MHEPYLIYSVDSVSHIVRERTAVDRQRVQQRTRYRMIYVAGLLAVLLVFAVQTGTRYVMNDWTRSKLERVMSINLHRTVVLGRATWSLGLNGLILAVERMVVLDRLADSPFITSDYAEIGVPLLPLLAGSLEARSMTFKNPKVYAVKIGRTQWNFSDLPDIDALRNVSYVDVQGGELHLLDRSNTPPATWSPRILSNATFHFERPFQNRTWPFRLAFRMPHEGYITNILITGIGNGNVHDWAKNKHQFDIEATDINLQDFSDSFPQIPPITGRMNAEVHGQGIPEKGFNVTAVIRSPLLTIETPGFGALTVRNALTSGEFVANKRVFLWNNVFVNLGRSFLLQTNGRIIDWQTETPSYEATAVVQADDINKLARVLPARVLPHQLMAPHMAALVAADSGHNINIEQALAPTRLSGAVLARARIKGHGKRTDYIWADVDARNISMSRIADLRPLRSNPIIAIIGANPHSTLNVHVTALPTGRTIIDYGHIRMGRSIVNFAGSLQPRTSETFLTYHSRNLNLADVTPGVRETAASRKLNSILGLPADTRMRLSGFMDIDGIVHAQGDQNTIKAIARLRGAGLDLGNGRLRASRVGGRLVFDGETLTTGGLRGYINNGAFDFRGSISVKPNGPMNFAYRGKTIDLEAVKQAAAVIGINSPFLQSRYLRGNIDNVILFATGTVKNPVITLDGDLRNLMFQPEGSPGIVRVVGGKFRVRDNRVALEDIRGTIGGGSFILRGTAAAGGAQIAMAGTNVDIAAFRQALIDLHIDAPIITGPEVLFGTMRTAVLVINTSVKPTQFSLVGSPAGVYYQARGMPRAFLLTSGNLNITNTLAMFRNLRGYIGKGSFTLNGSMALTGNQVANINFQGRNLDLSNLKLALQAMHVQSPLLAQQMLYGIVRRLQFAMKGPTKKPEIALTAYPADVHFEPYGTKRTMHAVSGMVTYEHDTFTGKNLVITNARTRLIISMRIEHLSDHSRLTDFHVRSRGIDLGDLNAYLIANSTPATIRKPYLDLLKRFGIENPVGMLAGRFDYTEARPGRPFHLYSNMALRSAGVTLNGMRISSINGLIRSEGDRLIAENFTGRLEEAPLRISLIARDLQTTRPSWSGEVVTSINVQNMLALLPANFANMVHTDRDIPVRLGIFGTPARTAAVFTGRIAPGAEFTIDAPIGQLTKPVGQPVCIVGLMVYRNSKPNSLAFYDSHIDIGRTRIAWHGEYYWPKDQLHEQPIIDFTVSIPGTVPARSLLALMPAPQLEDIVQQISGRIGGEVHFVGPLNAPLTRGRIDLCDVAVPALNLSSITGTLSAENLHQIDINLRTLRAGPIALTGITGTLISEQTNEGQRWTMQHLLARLYDGSTTINGSVLLSADRPFNVDASLADVDLDKLATEAFSADDEVTGKLSAFAHVSGRAGNMQNLMRSLVGNGHFLILNGSVKRLAQLESGVQLLNILDKGVLGFNPADFLSAIARIHKGSFSCFSGDAYLHDCVVDVARVNFMGKELRFRAQGTVELATKDAEFEVIGNLPRNPNTILKGPIGAFLQHLSISNIVNDVTLGIASHFPKLPILGRLGTDRKPRAFEFVAAGNFDDPSTFTKSVMKTFKWLPNVPFATPHPVFGVGAPPEAVPQ